MPGVAPACSTEAATAAPTAPASRITASDLDASSPRRSVRAARAIGALAGTLELGLRLLGRPRQGGQLGPDLTGSLAGVPSRRFAACLVHVALGATIYGASRCPPDMSLNVGHLAVQGFLGHGQLDLERQ